MGGALRRIGGRIGAHSVQLHHPSADLLFLALVLHLLRHAVLCPLQSSHLVGHPFHPTEHHFHPLAERLGAHVHRLQLAMQLLRRLEPSLRQRLVRLRLDDRSERVAVFFLGGGEGGEGSNSGRLVSANKKEEEGKQ